MANEPVVDLSTIDLTQIAITADEVGRINPQAGDMRQLDHVVHIDVERGLIVGVKHVREDEFWVAGHIPGRPLLPGVLMIEAVAQLSCVFFCRKLGEDRFLGFTRCDDTAFRGQVLPGQTLYLAAKELSCRPRRFVSRGNAFVNGKLVFESTITGMVL